ncbi:MAG TPA: hypothetical protein VFB43_21455 [Terracidiphilus sp.]|jgi:hypothetical protein|nr:hypothetical protein [Terracidiphilus sp.]
MFPFGLIEIKFARLMIDSTKAGKTNRIERAVVVLAMGEMVIISP